MKTIRAIVRPRPMTNSKYEFSLFGWKIVRDAFVTTIFEKEFGENATLNDCYRSTEELHNILSSMFLADGVARSIEGFWYEPSGLHHELLNIFFQVFGAPLKVIDVNESAISVHDRLSLDHVFNLNPELALASEILGWVDFLGENSQLSLSIKMISESFGIINAVSARRHYFDYATFISSIILLVSGLESIFARGSKNDISFQFSQVGAAFYHSFVTDNFIKKFNVSGDLGKYEYLDFLAILKFLYDIRSRIAHGSSVKPDKYKGWKKLIRISKIQYSDADDYSRHLQHCLFALRLLQPHILAILCQCREHLLAGSDIISELVQKVRLES